MDEDRTKVTDMRNRIMHGDYRVEPAVVAEAILRRLRELAVARGECVRTEDRAWAAAHPLRVNAHNLRARPASH